MAPLDDTDPRLSTECADNVGGLPGVIVYDDSTFPIFSQHDAEWTASDDGQGPYSQEEEEEEEEEDDYRHLQPSGINIIDMAHGTLSIECVDNADGLPGVIVYDDKTFPISSQQETAFGAGQGSHSSVRILQTFEIEDGENALDCDPLESVSKARYDNDDDDDDEVSMQADPQV